MRGLIELLSLISDGQYHSGESLGKNLNISRASIWKRIRVLQSMGFEIYSIRGKGYRLLDAIELLDKQKILSNIGSTETLASLEVLSEIDSTNAYMLSKAGQISTPAACLSESQTAGRGRRGKPWVSPFGSNIYLSLLWTAHGGLQSLDGLSLMIGVSIAKTLSGLGCPDVQLKWPNDIYANKKKLGGVLVELTGNWMDQAHVVIGIGLNQRITQEQRQHIEQPIVDLAELGWSGSRNELAGKLINQLLLDLRAFEEKGFSMFQDDWNARNVYEGCSVEVLQPRSRLLGECQGVNERGELLLKTEQGILKVHSGELSLRPVSKEI